jgi:DNA-directed RNA polymerase I subunit RPA43
MSAADVGLVKDKKIHKSKSKEKDDSKSEKKSKKRKHEEAATAIDGQSRDGESSPKKKHKDHHRHGRETIEQHRSSEMKKKHKKQHSDHGTANEANDRHDLAAKHTSRKKRHNDEEVEGLTVHNADEETNNPDPKKGGVQSLRSLNLLEIDGPAAVDKKEALQRLQAWTDEYASLSDLQTPVHYATVSLYLPISPITFHDPILGVCAEYLSPLLLSYYAPVKGVVLGYKDVKLSSKRPRFSSHSKKVKYEEGDEGDILAVATDEYAAPLVWVTATFLVFRPLRGVRIPGCVNMMTESHVGFVCFNTFTASVPKHRLPKGWSWVWDEDDNPATSKNKERRIANIEESINGTGSEEDGAATSRQSNGTSLPSLSRRNVIKGATGRGNWIDESGEQIPKELWFTIREFELATWGDAGTNFISLKGTLLSEEDDAEVDKQRRTKRKEALAQKRRSRAPTARPVKSILRGGTPGASGTG